MNMVRTSHLLFLASLFPSTLRAADHHVALGSTLSTIDEAMAVALDGDRIFVHPGTYPSFGFSRSVDVLALSADSAFTIAGDVVVYMATNRKVFLSGARVLGAFRRSDASFTLAQVEASAMGCTFNTVDMSDGYYTLTLQNCAVRGYLTFARGTVTGCRIKGEPEYMMAGASVVSLTSGGPAGTFSTRRYLLGNEIGESLSASYVPNVVTLETDAPFTFSNNFVHGSPSPSAKPAVKTKKPKEVYLQVTLQDCFITSYSVRVPSGGQVTWLEDSVSMFQPTFRCMLQNNHIVGASPFTGSATCFPQTYNVVSNALSDMDPITGLPAPGSSAINAGDPSVAYLDLDLSRNDAGCWGGSWSMANFQPTGTGPRITVVHVPRTAVSGSSITMAANAALR